MKRGDAMPEEKKEIESSHLRSSDPMPAGKPQPGKARPKVAASESCSPVARDSEDSCHRKARIIWLGYCPWISLGRRVERDD